MMRTEPVRRSACSSAGVSSGGAAQAEAASSAPATQVMKNEIRVRMQPNQQSK